MSAWRAIPCSIQELRLDLTLASGQSFRWVETSPGIWTGVLAGYIFSLRQDDHSLFYHVHQLECSTACPISRSRRDGDRSKSGDSHDDTNIPVSERNYSEGVCSEAFGYYNLQDKYESILRDYFQLQINLGDLYRHFSKVDHHFQSIATRFPGIRVLRQDPVENLFSFICSTNNTIPRVIALVEKLCVNYGDYLGTVDGLAWYSFPTPERLSFEGVQKALRRLGFGYRTKYISDVAKYLHQEQRDTWLTSLRKMSYSEAKNALMNLTGVGAKVADCVCLMSLDKFEAIPVDTHVWQIACRDYLPDLRSAKSVTNTVYSSIGYHLRQLWGSYAGWAQAVVFTADIIRLSDFKKDSLEREKERTRKTKYDKIERALSKKKRIS